MSNHADELIPAVAAIGREALALTRFYEKRKAQVNAKLTPEIVAEALNLARRLRSLHDALEGISSELKDLKIGELRTLAAQLGIEKVFSYPKADLINLILNKRGQTIVSTVEQDTATEPPTGERVVCGENDGVNQAEGPRAGTTC